MAITTMVVLVLWGLIHIAGGGSLAVANAVEGLEAIGPNVIESVPDAPGEAAEGLVRFHGLNIALGGLAVTALAIAWWRRQSRGLLMVAFGVIVALDLGLLAFLVIPGIMPASQGLIGPMLAALCLPGVLAAARERPVVTTRTRAIR